MLSRRLIPLTVGMLMLAGPMVRAQDGATRIGSCNPSKVFAGLDERKSIEDKLNDEGKKFRVEVDRRKAELEAIRQDRENLKPESAAYLEKTNDLMKKTIEAEVWVKLKQAEAARQEKDQIKSLFDKIRAACKEIAVQKRLDMVLAERKPELPANQEQMTPDQLRALLGQNDVLYMNDQVDITQEVILLLNKKFAAEQTGKK